MTPAQRMRELIACPLVKCYPADPPKRRKLAPAALVWGNRRKMRRYLEEQRAGL